MTLLSETGAVAQQQASQVTAQIPFRQSGSSGSQDVIGAFLAAVLLLIVTAALLLLAKRKGWLARWMPVMPISRAQPDAPKVESAVRLSKNTVIYCVEHRTDRFLILESDRNATAISIRSLPHGASHDE